jgi:hypothetical protein
MLNYWLGLNVTQGSFFSDYLERSLIGCNHFGSLVGYSVLQSGYHLEVLRTYDVHAD